MAVEQTRVYTRLLDIKIALLGLLLLAPWLLLRALWAWLRGGRLWVGLARVGQQRQVYQAWRYADLGRGSGLLELVNLLRGDIALVGPRPLNPREAANWTDAHHFALPPGWLNPYALRQRMGLAYADEAAADADFVANYSLRAYLGLLLRGPLTLLLTPERPLSTPPQFELLGVRIDNLNMQAALDWLTAQARSDQPATAAFVNADCLNITYGNADYRAALHQAGRVFADGSGIRLGARRLGWQVRDNVNGTDLLPLLCERCAAEGLSLYLLGARPGVAEAAAAALQVRFPGLLIAGCRDGYFAADDEDAVIAAINASGAHILLVALGAPRQELWLHRLHERLTVPVRLGVGGLFDFYSGRIPRAPQWLRELGLEWVWRLLQEPGRLWRRYLIGNPLFLWRVRKQATTTAPDPVQAMLGQLSHLGTTRLRQQSTFQFKRLLWLTVVRGTYLVKRLLDISASALLLLLLSPLFALIMLLIRLESPGSVFFKQIRVGRYGKLFPMWKFRSMYIDAEQRLAAIRAQNEMAGGVLFKMKNDPRITRIGRFIRKASIDELPQLWNVLCGEMSLVGPRPALPREVDQYSLADRRRLAVTPGITCIWQVSGRSDIPFPDQVRLDVDYIHSQSIVTDIKLLLRTVPAVLLGRGAY